MRETILVVDDSEPIADLIALYLENENFSVVKCYTARDALAHIETDDIDLAILDIMLPETDGFAICREIRSKRSYPVIMLTAKIASIDKINGLALGADDYVTKPFDPIELVARVKAQLRRCKKYNAQPDYKRELTVSDLRLDLDKHSCTQNGRPLELTPTEFSILRILCLNRGSAVKSEELFRQVWGEEYFSKSTNPVPVHIRHIREKMNDSVENPKYIKTVWGVGYKIEG